MVIKTSFVILNVPPLTILTAVILENGTAVVIFFEDIIDLFTNIILLFIMAK